MKSNKFVSSKNLISKIDVNSLLDLLTKANIKDQEETEKLQQYAMMGKLRTKEKDPLIGIEKIDQQYKLLKNKELEMLLKQLSQIPPQLNDQVVTLTVAGTTTTPTVDMSAVHTITCPGSTDFTILLPQRFILRVTNNITAGIVVVYGTIDPQNPYSSVGINVATTGPGSPNPTNTLSFAQDTSGCGSNYIVALSSITPITGALTPVPSTGFCVGPGPAITQDFQATVIPVAGWIAACGWCQVRVGSTCPSGESCVTPAQVCIECPGTMLATIYTAITCGSPGPSTLAGTAADSNSTALVL